MYKKGAGGNLYSDPQPGGGVIHQDNYNLILLQSGHLSKTLIAISLYKVK